MQTCPTLHAHHPNILRPNEMNRPMVTAISQARPFRDVFNSYLALGCSLSLSVMLLCADVDR